jgi:UDP-N-acetylglucosamine 2-epimerase (non-hydrolysing)
VTDAPLPPGSIALVLGTRPEIIKLAEVARLLGPAARVIYTGQHYDERLGPRFFHELGLPAAHVVLTVGGAPRAQQIGAAVVAVDRHFAEQPPLAVIVQGDTNATVAGALAANARDVPLVHVEAGLRSHDRAMPEEHNRIIVDHLADLCCAPTDTARDNLAREGISGERVVVTGNTVVEALLRLVPPQSHRRDLVRRRGLVPDAFVLSTFHRPENVDDPERLADVLHQLASLTLPVVLPLHPRTAARLRDFGLGSMLDALRVTDPMSYGDFLGLASECAFMVSDSGGVQEEASVLRRPVIVVRNSTERPEVLGTFARLVPPGPGIAELAATWTADLGALHQRLRALPSPYGDGSASTRCVAATHDLLSCR